MSKLGFVCGVFLVCWVLSAAGHQDAGIATTDLAAILAQLPPSAPVVFVSRAPQLVKAQDAMVVVTGCYADGSERTRSAKAYIFLRETVSWTEVFSTDEDGRLAEYGAPASWEISFERLDFADVDGDELNEVVVYWNSAPPWAVSLIQYDRIINVIDYDAATGAFSEITGDQFVYNEFMDDAFLMDVDSDEQLEIVFLQHTKLGECVICQRPYRLSVWEVRSGKLVPDLHWNDGKPLEIEGEYYLFGCGRVELVSLVLQAAGCGD